MTPLPLILWPTYSGSPSFPPHPCRRTPSHRTPAAAPLPPQLSDQSERVRRYRDALRGPLGRLSAAGKQRGDWWGENANKDTNAAKTYRKGDAANKADSGNTLHSAVDECARPLTNWGPNNAFQLASPFWWAEQARAVTPDGHVTHTVRSPSVRSSGTVLPCTTRPRALSLRASFPQVPRCAGAVVG